MVLIVGMAGSGKSEVANIFEENGFKRVRFGDITDDEVRRRGLGNVTPYDVYSGRHVEIIQRRKEVKSKTLTARRDYNRTARG